MVTDWNGKAESFKIQAKGWAGIIAYVAIITLASYLCVYGL
jgi:hypothetical protein